MGLCFRDMIQFLDGFGGGLTGILLITSITTTGGLLSMILWTCTGHKLMATFVMNAKVPS